MSDTPPDARPVTYHLIDAYFVIEDHRAYVKAHVEVAGEHRYFAVDVSMWDAENVHGALQRLTRRADPPPEA